MYDLLSKQKIDLKTQLIILDIQCIGVELQMISLVQIELYIFCALLCETASPSGSN